MQLEAPKAIFENRSDAGAKLAGELAAYAGLSALVLAIPNGGVPVAIEVAGALKADLDVVVSRKIPVPVNLEGGLGAITEDGTYIINEDIVKRNGITSEQIEYEASKVKAGIKQRIAKYRGDRLPIRTSGRVVIIVDDGLASGVTMTAAVESVKHRKPKAIVVAVPVAPATAMSKLNRIASKVVTCATAMMPKFFLADYYRHWRDISDDEVVRLLEHWRARQSG